MSAVISTKRAIQAIPTDYNGVHFRSRLEARWAVFLDAFLIPWQYEPEKFQVSASQGYIPDFFLPDMANRTIDKVGLWLEIKPTLDFVEWKKSYHFARKLFSEPSAEGVTSDGVVVPDHFPYRIGTSDFRFFAVYTDREGVMWFPEKWLVKTKAGRVSIEGKIAYGKPVDLTWAINQAKNYRFEVRGKQ